MKAFVLRTLQINWVASKTYSYSVNSSATIPTSSLGQWTSDLKTETDTRLKNAHDQKGQNTETQLIC